MQDVLTLVFTFKYKAVLIKCALNRTDNICDTVRITVCRFLFQNKAVLPQPEGTVSVKPPCTLDRTQYGISEQATEQHSSLHNILQC